MKPLNKNISCLCCFVIKAFKKQNNMGIFSMMNLWKQCLSQRHLWMIYPPLYSRLTQISLGSSSNNKTDPQAGSPVVMEMLTPAVLGWQAMSNWVKPGWLCVRNRFWCSKVKCQGHCDLTKHSFRHNSRIHTLIIMTKLHTYLIG